MSMDTETTDVEQNFAFEYDKRQFFNYIEQSDWMEALRVLEAGIYKPNTEDFKRVNELLIGKPIPDIALEWQKELDGFEGDGAAIDESLEKAYYGNSISFINFYRKLLILTLEDKQNFTEQLRYMESMQIPDVFSEYAQALNEDNYYPESIFYSYYIESIEEKKDLDRETIERILLSEIGFKNPHRGDAEFQFMDVYKHRLRLLKLYLEKFADEHSYTIALEIYANIADKAEVPEEIFDCILKICRKSNNQNTERIIHKLDELEIKFKEDDDALDRLERIRCLVDTRTKTVDRFGQFDIAGREITVLAEGENLKDSKAQLVSRRGDILISAEELNNLIGLINAAGLRQGNNERKLTNIDAKALGLPTTDFAVNLQREHGETINTVKDLYKEFIESPRLKDLGVDLFEFSLKEQARLMLLVLRMKDAEWKTFSGACSVFPSLIPLTTKIDYKPSEILELIHESGLDNPETFKENSLTANLQINLSSIIEMQEVIFRDLELTEEEKAVVEYGVNKLVKKIIELDTKYPTNSTRLVRINHLDLGETNSQINLVKGLAYLGLTSDLLGNEQIDLAKHSGLIRRLENLVIENKTVNTKLKKTLYGLGFIAPTPEYHWRVDRDLREYNERASLDIPAILDEIKTGKKDSEPIVCVEIGPGNGLAKRELKEKFGDSIIQYAVCDKAYFPLGKYIESILNFEALERDAGITLTRTEKQAVADYIYIGFLE